jgi:hypothetical protein
MELKIAYVVDDDPLFLTCASDAVTIVATTQQIKISSLHSTPKSSSQSRHPPLNPGPIDILARS